MGHLRLQIVNLVSNDVRRFDDAGPFWVRRCYPLTRTGLRPRLLGWLLFEPWHVQCLP